MKSVRVDILDNTIICKDDDLQKSLNYMDENRELPAEIEKIILQVVFKELGLKYDNGLSIKENLNLLPKNFLREIVLDINTMFKGSRKVDYRDCYLPYVIYYLPVNVFKVWKPLLDLHIKSTLKKDARILDIGTGPASVPLGIIEFYKKLAQVYEELDFSLEFVLVDAQPNFLRIANKIIEAVKVYLPSNLKFHLKESICAKVTAESNFKLGKFDLISMSNFLAITEGNNSQYSYDLVSQFADMLEDDGSFIIIEPGDVENCINLKRLRNSLVKDGVFNVYSPCLGIWEKKDDYVCNCFSTVRLHWELPNIFIYLKENGLRHSLRRDVPFNYAVLRKDGLTKYDPITNIQHFTKLCQLDNNIGKVINIIAFIRTSIYKENYIKLALCDGSTHYNGYNEGVWIDIPSSRFKDIEKGIKLVAGERIRILKVLVQKSRINNTYNLKLTDESRITLNY